MGTFLVFMTRNEECPPFLSPFILFFWGWPRFLGLGLGFGVGVAPVRALVVG